MARWLAAIREIALVPFRTRFNSVVEFSSNEQPNLKFPQMACSLLAGRLWPVSSRQLQNQWSARFSVKGQRKIVRPGRIQSASQHTALTTMAWRNHLPVLGRANGKENRFVRSSPSRMKFSCCGALGSWIDLSWGRVKITRV